MRVLLLLGSPLKLRRESFQHALVIRIEGLYQFFPWSFRHGRGPIA